MIDERIYEMFREIGRDLYTANMISSHGGNLSIRLGDHVIIKRRGAMLGNLKPHDLIETRIDKNDSGVALASTELLVHRTIYLNKPRRWPLFIATRARQLLFRFRAMRSCRLIMKPPTC